MYDHNFQTYQYMYGNNKSKINRINHIYNQSKIYNTLNIILLVVLNLYYVHGNILC